MSSARSSHGWSFSLLLVVSLLLWHKQDRFLCKRTGVTDTNWGLDSMMFGVLTGVTELTTCLQTTGQPIQHRVAREILATRRALKRNFEHVRLLKSREPHNVGLAVWLSEGESSAQSLQSTPQISSNPAPSLHW